MLFTQAVYALYSVVLFMKVKPITGTPHVWTTKVETQIRLCIRTYTVLQFLYTVTDYCYQLL